MGKLRIVGSDRWFHTLEDFDRSLDQEMPLSAIRMVKVKHETAIPYGRYEVIISYSSRFKKLLPLLLDVPAFDGIRIHAGNKDKDTSGCILLGKIAGENFVGQSVRAMTEFFPILESSLKTERCYVDIVRADFTRRLI